MELSIYCAVSLDGFIARENGSMDWLRGGGPRPAAEERQYRAFTESIDAIVMGRATYETVRAFPTWPYGTKPVVVLSHSEVNVPTGLAATVERMSGSPSELLPQLESRGWQHIYVDGGRTVPTQGAFSLT